MTRGPLDGFHDRDPRVSRLEEELKGQQRAESIVSRTMPRAADISIQGTEDAFQRKSHSGKASLIVRVYHGSAVAFNEKLTLKDRCVYYQEIVWQLWG